MKRRIIATLILFACIAMILSGCTFIRINEERESNQVLATVTVDGITLHITQLEFLDYLNSNAQSVMENYNFDIDEVIEFLLEKKIESKYVLIKAMKELQNQQFSHRHSVTRNLVNPQKPEDLLTWGEYYFAIKSVNDEILATIDRFIADYEADALQLKIDAVNKENIESIEIVEGSFEDTYYQKQVVELDEVRLRVNYKAADEDQAINEEATSIDDKFTTYYYEDGSVAAVEMPVNSAMYLTPFSTDEAGMKTVEIAFEERILDGDEFIYEQHTAEWEYEVIAVRDTKVVEEEEKDQIPNRYLAKNDFDSEDIAEFLSLEKAKYNSVAEEEAYRRLRNNLKNQKRPFETLYQSAFESSVLSALSFELGEKAKAVGITQEAVQAEYDYLILTSREVYEGLSKEAQVTKFQEAINSNLETLYYYPEVDNIEQYFYVQQILFNFSDTQKDFIEANKGSKELDKANENLLNYFNEGGIYNPVSIFELIGQGITSRESNPDYDPEDEDSLPYATDDNGVIKDLQKLFGAEGILEKLEAELLAAEDAQARMQIFDDYIYRYNDDPGIMNNPTGYLIPPKGVQSGFYDAFVKLGQALYEADASEGNAFINGKLAYCYTDYGVHILMISLLPFENAETEGGSFPIDKELDLNGTNFYDIIEKKLIDQAKAKAYEDFAKVHIDNAQDHANINTKKINKLIKDIKG